MVSSGAFAAPGRDRRSIFSTAGWVGNNHPNNLLVVAPWAFHDRDATPQHGVTAF
jgi:hypothetical protein